MIMHGVYGKNITKIKNAKPSSDVYALVEKTAYFLFDLKYSSDDVQNWFNSQRLIARWSKCHTNCEEHGTRKEMNFPEDLEAYISKKKRELDAKHGTNPRHKDTALDEIANEIISFPYNL